MKCSFCTAVVILVLSNVGLVTPFGVVSTRTTTTSTPASCATTSARAPTSPVVSTVRLMAKQQQDDDLLRAARAARTAGSDDTVVELMRPLGLVLNQDENGNVYVETLAPKGNAARTGKVRSFFFIPFHLNGIVLCPVDDSIWCCADKFYCVRTGSHSGRYFGVC
jgi:hypothetical protein